ncbi:MAG: hypothetical protein ABL970_08895, partial [Nitrospira sp.]
MSQSRDNIVGLLTAVVVIGSAVHWPVPLCAAEDGRDEVQAISPITEVEVPQMEIRDRAIQPAGTGSLHLEEKSASASRLGVSIREIPASVEVIDHTLMQERGLRT